MKCEDCGSYNTVREKGPLMRRDPGGGSSFSTSLDPDLAAMDQEDEDVNSNLEEELPELETNSPLLEQLEVNLQLTVTLALFVIHHCLILHQR